MGLTEMDMYWMKIALEKAEEAFQAEEVPVGAVLVESSGRFFADRNRTAETGMPTSHAEHLVITAAAEDRDDWRLEGCTLYSTLEPCLMCAGALIWARIERIVYSAKEPKFGMMDPGLKFLKGSKYIFRNCYFFYQKLLH